MINDKNNDVTVAGADLFADSESFFNELTDSEMAQILGGASANFEVGGVRANVETGDSSGISLLLCD